MPDHNPTSSPVRLFLTGDPASGKTTILRRTGEMLVLRGFKVGGMISGEIRKRGSRIGFSVEDLLSHDSGVLAEITGVAGPRVGRYTVNIHDLEAVGAKSIMSAIDVADVILIDELGPMELNSSRFVDNVAAALMSSKHILGTIHRHANHPLICQVRSNAGVTIINVSNENRESLPDHVTRMITDRT